MPSPAAQTATLALLGLTQTSITVTPTLWLLSTPNAGVTPMSFVPTTLLLTQPTCYETPLQGLTCMGVLRNTLEQPLKQITLRVNLVSKEGRVLDFRDVPLARMILDPGASSPYGVAFERIPAGYIGPVVLMLNASQGKARALRLETRGAQMTLIDGMVRINGTVANRDSVTAHKIVLLVTLLDNRERVTGFRQANWAAEKRLRAGESLPFSLDIIPQNSLTTHFEVSADGQPD